MACDTLLDTGFVPNCEDKEGGNKSTIYFVHESNTTLTKTEGEITALSFVDNSVFAVVAKNDSVNFTSDYEPVDNRYKQTLVFNVETIGCYISGQNEPFEGAKNAIEFVKKFNSASLKNPYIAIVTSNGKVPYMIGLSIGMRTTASQKTSGVVFSDSSNTAITLVGYDTYDSRTISPTLLAAALDDGTPPIALSSAPVCI